MNLLHCPFCGRDVDDESDCPSDDCPGIEIVVTQIGTIQRGQDGSDQYVLLTNKLDDLTPEQAKGYLLPKVYRDCRNPGGYFCTSVSAAQAEYSDNQVICTIHHRYDN